MATIGKKLLIYGLSPWIVIGLLRLVGVILGLVVWFGAMLFAGAGYAKMETAIVLGGFAGLIVCRIFFRIAKRLKATLQ